MPVTISTRIPRVQPPSVWRAGVILFMIAAGTGAGSDEISATLFSWPTRPYLAVIGAPPFRLQPSPPPLEQITRPLVLAKSPGSERRTVEAPVHPSGEASPVADSGPAPTAAHDRLAESAQREPETPTSAPPPIIPDDTVPRARPEDVLPFFQFPANGGASPDHVNVILPGIPMPPAPATLPPSSATYRQQ